MTSQVDMGTFYSVFYLLNHLFDSLSVVGLDQASLIEASAFSCKRLCIFTVHSSIIIISFPSVSTVGACSTGHSFHRSIALLSKVTDLKSAPACLYNSPQAQRRSRAKYISCRHHQPYSQRQGYLFPAISSRT